MTEPSSPAGTVILKRDRAKPVVQRHPWVFSGAIDRVDGRPSSGDIVDVEDADGNWLGRGSYNARSQIVIRLVTWERDEVIDCAFWRLRLEQAVSARAALAAAPSTNAYRLVYAESDYCPGLIVDRYAQYLVVQLLTAGVERWRGTLISLLAESTSPRGIYERSDVEIRGKEGLPQRNGLLWGEEPPPVVEIMENGRRFLVDIHAGQKTGFYLDQRENRSRVAGLSKGREVLDVFAYSGACAAYALTGGATQTTLVDSSASALLLAQRNLAENGLGRTRYDIVEGDAFSVLRAYRRQGRRFDAIVLDPPKLASSQREVVAAARAYKDINMLGFQLLRPSGLLFTTSCSGAVSADLFQKIVFGALIDARRDGQIVGYLAQGSDHPVSLTYPESAYLKGLVVRVV